MNVEQISREAARIKKLYDETDPFKICRAMKILILYQPMGTHNGACKGFYLEHNRCRCITLNSDLPEVIQRIILTHELGHSVLHRNASGICTFHEFSLFDETSHMEYEANIYAAEFLLEDNDVLEALNSDTSFSGTAAALHVPEELLDFKFRVMKKKGYKMINPPMMANSDFLKNIRLPHEDTEVY